MTATTAPPARQFGRRGIRRLPAGLLGSLVALAVAGAFLGLTGLIYWWSEHALIAEIHAGLLRSAATAQRQIDVARHLAITRPEHRGSAEYEQATQPLQDILAADPHVAYAWTAVQRDGTVYFVLDGTPVPPPNSGVEDQGVAVFEPYPNPPPALLTAFSQDRPMMSEPYTDEWGTFISAFHPFHDAEGKLVGVVGLDLKITDFLTRLAPIRNATLIAAGIGVCIAVVLGLGVWFNRKTDRTARELARQLRTVNSLLAVSRALGSGVSVDDLLPVIIKQGTEVMAGEHGAVLLLDESSGCLKRSTAEDVHGEAPFAPAGIVSRVLKTQRPANVADVSKDSDFDPMVDAHNEAGTRALLVVPIAESGGKLLGAMKVRNKIGADSFDEDDEILLEAIAAQVAIALERARLTQVWLEKQKLDDALKLAASIQMSMLSRSFPPLGESAVDVHACLQPAKQVGGDFYDFFWMNDKELAFLVADVAGKGMPAALFMAKAKTLIKAHASLVRDPDEILTRANDELSIDNDNGMFVTVFLGVLNVTSGRVRFTNAGHNPPYLLSPSTAGVKPLASSNGIALGVMEGMPYPVSEISLQPGETLFLYTDGVNEAMSVDDELFDYARLEHVLQGSHTNVVALDESVLSAVQAFAAGTEQSDDITILSVCWRGR